MFDKVALDGGYDAVVTGHNLDDEAAVLYGNVMRWQVDYLGRQHPLLEPGDGFPRKAKPLVFRRRRDLCVLPVGFPSCRSLPAGSLYDQERGHRQPTLTRRPLSRSSRRPCKTLSPKDACCRSPPNPLWMQPRKIRPSIRRLLSTSG